MDVDAIEQFRSEGATVIRGLLEPEWLDLIASGVDHNAAHPSKWSHWYTRPDEAVGFWTDYVTWPDVEQYRRATFAERPWEVSPPYGPDGLEVGGLLGDDPRFPIVPVA